MDIKKAPALTEESGTNDKLDSRHIGRLYLTGWSYWVILLQFSAISGQHFFKTIENEVSTSANPRKLVTKPLTLAS